MHQRAPSARHTHAYVSPLPPPPQELYPRTSGCHLFTTFTPVFPPCLLPIVPPGAVPAHQRASSARHAGLAEAQVRGLGHGAGAGGGRGSGSTRPRLPRIPRAGTAAGDAAVRGAG